MKYTTYFSICLALRRKKVYTLITVHSGKVVWKDVYKRQLMYNEYVAGKYINRQIMMAVPKVILFVHKNGRI